MKLTDVLGKPIQTQDGKNIGHVLTVYAKQQKNNTFIVTSVVYGKKSVLTRLGFNRFYGKQLRWEKVQKITQKRILVKSHSK